MNLSTLLFLGTLWAGAQEASPSTSEEPPTEATSETEVGTDEAVDQQARPLAAPVSDEVAPAEAPEEALAPQTILLADPPTLEATERLELAQLLVQLERSVEQAGVAVEQAELDVAAAGRALKVAKTELVARKAQYKAATSQLKVDKLGNDPGALHASAQAVDMAKFDIELAKHEIKLRTLERDLCRKQVDHAETAYTLEVAKLHVVQGRLSDPPMDDQTMSTLESDRAKAETQEAKARIVVSKAVGRIEKEKLKAPEFT